ncbi:MAG: stage II sporulation protein R [Clostridia bacterium]|nr:stage II sporulation protein R [Clostridia bacterium]
MKKVCIIFLLSIIISLTVFGFSGEFGQTALKSGEYLRIHIRADSNEAEAQAVKYLVRDGLVDYLTPIVAECETKTQAINGVRENLFGIEKKAERILSQNGFFYGARASLKKESFPTRVYGDYTLPAGEYTALIVELGEGKGDNWWCVVYPPLCFAAPSGGNVVYKSKILEIIENWKNG